MSDLFKLEGCWSAGESCGLGNGCGAPSWEASFCESMYLAQKESSTYTLAADPAVPVAFGGVTDANVVIITSDRKIMLTVTSADGTAQTIPCDGLTVLISETVPFTAITLTRVPATETRVRVFLGEKTT